MLRHFVWTVSVLFPLFSSAQSNSALPSVDSVAVRLRRQLALYPQEKIYLHTDKPYYMAGDTIRFRAHVVDAASHAPVSMRAVMSMWISVAWTSLRSARRLRHRSASASSNETGYMQAISPFR